MLSAVNGFPLELSSGLSRQRRKAKTLRSVALRPGVERGAHPARMDTDALSTICSSQRVSGRGAGEELQRDLREELLRRERKCESGSGVLPVARSAVPAGTRARLLLTYIRLVEGGRLQRDRVQRDAARAHLELRKTITNGALSGRERSRLRRACSCLRSTAVGL